jgi:hypothetical protein
LEPRWRPKSNPSKLADEVKQQAVQVRAALENAGVEQLREIVAAMIGGGMRTREIGKAVPTDQSTAVRGLQPRVYSLQSGFSSGPLAAPDTGYVMAPRFCGIWPAVACHSKLALVSGAGSDETVLAA